MPFIENGKSEVAPGEMVSHGDPLNVTCIEKYEIAYSSLPAKCHNGTFLYVPICQPASCKQPPAAPKKGIVIAPKTDFGMKARFACYRGYKVVGNDTTICVYGNWTGETPTCQESKSNFSEF